MARKKSEEAPTAVAVAPVEVSPEQGGLRGALDRAAKAAVVMGGEAVRLSKSAAVLVGDLNGDGKVDEQDARLAMERARGMTGAAADEIGKLGKRALESDLVRDAAAGAAIGAVVAIPVPLVGPAAGAVVGAGLGVLGNLRRDGMSPKVSVGMDKMPKDPHAELVKLGKLKDAGLITAEEFEDKRRKYLKHL